MSHTSELSTRIDRDKLLTLSRDRAAELGHLLLEPLRVATPEEYLAGVAVVFAAMANRYGQGAEELYQYGLKILTAPTPHHTKGNALVDSLRDFADLKVRNDPFI